MFHMVFLSIFASIHAAAFQQSYETTYRPYMSSTVPGSYNPYKTGSYGSDIANFPEGTRYPNYSPSYGYSTSRYPNYNSNYNTGYSTNGYNSLYGAGSSNVNYNNNNYNLQRYGEKYGQGLSTGYTGYGSGTVGYGSGMNTGYGSNVGSGLGTGYNSGYGPGYGSSYGSGYGNGYSSGVNIGYGSGYGTGSGYSSYEAPFVRDTGSCMNRSPQSGIWVDSLYGIWYGVEMVYHVGVDYRADSRNDYYYQTCIVLHIAEPMERPSTENQLFHVQHLNAKFRQNYRHLRLLWDEAGQTIEYAVYFRNDTAGYWHVYDGQNGTLTSRSSYQQFGGTIQVLKAVNDHLLLNFCQEGNMGRSPQLYSVLFSRLPGQLSRWEIESVHSLLQVKRLSVASRRMVCGNNGADKAVVSIAFTVLTCFLSYVMGSSN